MLQFKHLAVDALALLSYETPIKSPHAQSAVASITPQGIAGNDIGFPCSIQSGVQAGSVLMHLHPGLHSKEQRADCLVHPDGIDYLQAFFWGLCKVQHPAGKQSCFFQENTFMPSGPTQRLAASQSTRCVFNHLLQRTPHPMCLYVCVVWATNRNSDRKSSSDADVCTHCVEDLDVIRELHAT